MAVTASQATFPTNRIGVLLVNLGTPDAPGYFAVQRYLREFLSDRRVIDTPRLIWLPLLYGIVLPFRPFKSARNYRKIWMEEGSPLAVYSGRLAAKVRTRLHSAYQDRVLVELGMSYGNPNLARVLQSFAEQGVDRLLVLPLYPQYCGSTTGSVIDGTNAALRRWRSLPEIRVINDYHDDPAYIQVLSRKIREHWATAGGRSHLLFSYHGIPASYVAKGDPYQRQTEITTQLVVKNLGLSAGDWSHCYQSRFGRVEWLKPYTLDKMKELVDRGVQELTVASPSFAVDCLETLEEVAIEYRDRFLEFGGKRLTLVTGLNDDEDHADALTELIKRRLGSWVQA
jgi:protoporphyrin/coproporphyrin ferrochelatase